ncbi:UDP-N-acetylglucosamine 1-carboxyvinyltransferase [Chakrabartyella piscis]|uniref:UDP-N-acetylglucosamine 1-carboxyvinyltransferase n=1 Tax=Chakrabartyella piscis TaxID=2918914 RepID=UPI002958321B|nr:UDP-N-acetylglucosamine 1-carboxyvinyltransferase [Chakrabartyella piscis]
MGHYVVEGGHKISGEFTVHGSKNACLPILAATLLAEDEVVLENCPNISDFNQTIAILERLGCTITQENRTYTIDTSKIDSVEIKEETVQKMRSSILFLGALLGRTKKAILGYPGGCTIGKRPIDLHLNSFEKMGICIEEEDGFLHCSTSHILGYHIYLPYPSVGATENILLLAVKAEGATVIHNAAQEPEIVALAEFLRRCGGEIYGAGTSTIFIEGVTKLHGTNFCFPFDRIEATTLLCASAMTGGDIALAGVEISHMSATLDVFEKIGCIWQQKGNWLTMEPPKQLYSNLTIKTGPFPLFPTDAQPFFASLLTLAEGTCMIIETVFEQRFRHCKELCKMGAQIDINGQRAKIYGNAHLMGTEVYGTDLRGTAALILAGFAAEGTTTIHGAEFVERGYEDITGMFTSLGGQIQLLESCHESK